MNENINIQSKDFILRLMSETQVEDLTYIYRGEFSQNISSQILALAEKNIDKLGMSSKIKKRVFHIMVESIQNITRHQDLPPEYTAESPLFIIQKQGAFYFITTGNLVEKTKIESLIEKLDKINSLDQDELNEFYREILSNGKLSTKGGAGLGLIEMARKSGNKLNYSLRQINDELVYFYLNSHIDTRENITKTEEVLSNKFSLKYLTDSHININKDNIILVYSSVFDQESLLSLISILDNQMGEKVIFKKKIISTMVEMMQNIIHHGEFKTQDFCGSRGIFYISKQKNYYYLNTFNYILKSKIDRLKEKLDRVNQLSFEELEDFYNAQLFDFQSATSKEAGLGIIEMRLKSKKPLSYKFAEINGDYSFYHLQVCLENISE